MLICLNGGPKFLTKLIPISKLISAFLFEQTELAVQAITSVPADVKVMWWQPSKSSFFKSYPALSEKPWLTEDNKHLLFDYVHLLKNIRNLWQTEKTGELIFDDDGVRWVAKWVHLKQLYNFESERVVKLSDLNEISIAPKPIERQQVSICLRMFSEKTYNALLIQSGISVNKNDTALFINVLTWWKILNVKSLQIDKLHNDLLQVEIRSPNDTQLDFIIEFDKWLLICLAVKIIMKNNYPKTLLLPYIILAMVSLCRHPLATSHKYVLLESNFKLIH